jgi:hypothetical protein
MSKISDVEVCSWAKSGKMRAHPGAIQQDSGYG